jgi:hypothetical protein
MHELILGWESIFIPVIAIGSAASDCFLFLHFDAGELVYDLFDFSSFAMIQMTVKAKSPPLNFHVRSTVAQKSRQLISI